MIKFFLSMLLIVGSFTFTFSQNSTCKCGKDCKCDANCKCGEKNGTGVCNCGPQCTCKYQAEQTCKCGPDCACRKGNPDGKCLCGPNCKCSQTHSHGMHPENKNIFLKMMDIMMMGMDSASLDASAEGNFLRQMIPHHQGAIEMARYEIANGTNKQMIQLAKSILVEQQGEIMEMNTLLSLYQFRKGEQPSVAYKTAMDDAMMKMMMVTPSDKDIEGKSVDCAFAMVMLPHHQAAVDMSTALLKLVSQGQVATYAARIISDQQIELQEMKAFVNLNCK